MRDVVMKMKPNRIEDLIAANALYRPGPMVHIDAYVSRKHGEQWTTPHPIMTEVLKETYGILVYQEQVSRLVNRLGGIELKQAFRLAKAISKKKTQMIESMREPFVKGCAEKGVARPTAEEIFDNILRFGGYAFNKSHSTGYALVAFKTAYMKVYYPTEYMAALLTLEMGSTDKVVEYIEECKRMGIRVDAPDINQSDNDFTVIRSERGRGEIRFGLQAIKGVGEKAVSAIRAARSEGGPFKSIFDFCERVDMSAVNRAVIEALIKCGAFDSTGATRKGLMMVVEDAIAAGTSAAADRRCGQLSLFGGAGGLAPRAEPRIPGDQWTEAEMLAHEKATLGFYVTRHPLTSHEQTLLKYATARTSDLKRYDDGAEVILGGLISRMRTVLTKSGRNAGSKMAIITLEDLWGQVEVVVFSKDLEKYQAQLVPESLVFFKGRVDRRREEPSLKATEVTPMELGDERLSSSVLLRVNCVGAEACLLKRIRDTINRFRGDRTVLIEMLTTGNLKVTLRANGRTGVTPTADFCRAMEAVLGEGSVVVTGSGRSLEAQAGFAGGRQEHSDEPTVYAEDVDDEPV
jgi:DNA polymerase-3 subunit alpha